MLALARRPGGGRRRDGHQRGHADGALDPAAPRLNQAQADARRLPSQTLPFDAVFGLRRDPVRRGLERVHGEVRVLRVGAVGVLGDAPDPVGVHDDPSERGLTADRSYFDRTPYAERDEAGRLTYAGSPDDRRPRARRVGLRLPLLVVEPGWPGATTGRGAGGASCASA